MFGLPMVYSSLRGATLSCNLSCEPCTRNKICKYNFKMKGWVVTYAQFGEQTSLQSGLIMPSQELLSGWHASACPWHMTA